jgi:hypothetical protein
MPVWLESSGGGTQPVDPGRFNDARDLPLIGDGRPAAADAWAMMTACP